VARTNEELDQAAAQVEGKGGSALAVAADVSEPDAASKIARAVERRFHTSCSILVNAAGIMGPVAELSEVDLSEWQRVIDVNLTGAFALCREVLPAMKQKGWGRIVNVTSGHARRVQPGVGPYAASKAALMHLTKIMDAETRDSGVRVFALEPGVARTQMSATMRSLDEVGVRASVVQGLREIEAGPGFVDPEESGELIRLAATGQADELAGEAVSIYEPEVRARLAS
jgi:NAD(P)-dependent dehydrogenase (short-subunit alcohol dehydrogenase family)